jgi:peptidoglycan/LPS O-acetylase OafA/YrhL
VLILGQHVFVTKIDPASTGVANGWPIPHLGPLGMTMFFTLSGFLMVYNYQAQFEGDFCRTLRRFYVARFARIYPLYLFALVTSFSFMGCFFHEIVHRTNETLRCLAFQLSLTQAWFCDVAFPDYNHPRPLYNAYLGVAWSVSVEIFFYATFPFVCVPIVRQLRSVRQVLGTGLVVLAAVVAIDLFTASPHLGTDFSLTPAYADSTMRWILYCSPYGRYGDFLMGCLAGKLLLLVDHHSSPVEERIVGWFAGLCAAGALTLTLMPRGMSDLWCFSWNVLKLNVGYVPFCVCFLLYLARYPSRVQRWLSRPAMILLGEASYGIYLMHPLVQSFYQRRSLGEDELVNFVVVLFNNAVMLTILHFLCLGTYQYVEHPLRSRLRGWLLGECRPALVATCGDNSTGLPQNLAA